MGTTQTRTEGWEPTVVPRFWRRRQTHPVQSIMEEGHPEPQPQLPSRSWVREGD